MGNSLNKTETSELRQKAEELLDEKSSKSTMLSETEMLKLMHELEVHQIELELQNEELRSTKTAAQEAFEKYRELYDFAPFGYFTLSSKGEILELNFSGAKMLGKERSRLINNRFFLYVSADNQLIFDDFFERIFSSRAKEFCEVTLLTSDKIPMYVQLTGIALEERKQCLISVNDITKSKLAEKAMIESQRLGAIGEMASSIAHDFNNSLQVISGNLELTMLNPEIPEDILRYLKIIRTTVDDAANRVKSLQRFDGKNQDKSHFTTADINILINEVISQSRPLWKDEAEKKGLSINIRTECGPISPILCDIGEIRTVLYNILKNSIEAMPKGGEIFVKTGERKEGIYITITDTGIGMNEETRARIFQPFYSTKGFNVGRGLGMSGVLTIIKEHGGSVQVINTAPGKGTSIEIMFPYPLKSDTDEKKIEKESSNQGGIIRTLWVDDEESITTMIKEMAKALGYKIDVANSGKEALKHMSKSMYDLVITDIGMPDMNGWQLASIIKEKFGDKINIAIASGWADQVSEEEKIKHSIVYNMNKPFTILQLQNLFKEVGHLQAVK